MWNQNVLKNCPCYEIKYIKCSVTLPKEKLTQYFFTFRAPLEHPQDKVLTALLDTRTHLNDCHSVCKPPPFIPFSCLTYVNRGVWSEPANSHHKQIILQGQQSGLLFLFQHKKKKGREEAAAIFRNYNSSRLDFWLTAKCLYPEMHYPVSKCLAFLESQGMVQCFQYKLL